MVFQLTDPPDEKNLESILEYLFDLKIAIDQVQADMNGLIIEKDDDFLTFNKFVIQETPPRTSGAIVFTSRPYRTGKLQVLRDQSMLQKTIDFTETTNTSYTLTTTPDGDEDIKHTYLAGD